MVESSLAFRKGATDAHSVQTQLEENKKKFAAYHLSISNVRGEATVPSCRPASTPAGAFAPAPGFLLSPGELGGAPSFGRVF